MTRDRVVAHVTTAHPATDNRIFWKECVALSDSGLSVHLVAVAPHDHTCRGVAVTALPVRRGRLRRMLVGPVDAWRALRAIRPHLIHVHDPELIPLAVVWKLLHRRPAVFDAHEDLSKQVAGKTYIPVFARGAVAAVAAAVEHVAGWGVDAVVAATPAIARKFDHSRVVLVQNFPWSSSFPEPAPLSDDTDGLAYVGAISQGRGLHEMLLATEVDDATLTLAGRLSGPDDQRAIDRYADRVTYLGPVAVEDIPGILASTRVGLAILHPLPNYLESQSTKIYEYMAAGRPFIASDFAAWTSQLAEFECGVFVDPLDRRAVGRAAERLLSDTALARAMGDRGRAAWEKHFTFEPQAAALVELTRELLGR